MIYLSSHQSIWAGGTQLEPVLVASDAIELFSEEIINTGYVRDDENSIVGNVSSYGSLLGSLNDNQIRGLGRASGFATGEYNGLSTTEMRIAFRVEDPMPFEMLGQLRLTPHSLGLNGSEAVVALVGDAGSVFEVRLDEGHLPDDLGNVNFMGSDTIRGMLAPGDYELIAEGLGQGSDGLTRCVDFDFTFRQAAVIPEPEGPLPASLALFTVCWIRRTSRLRRIGSH